MVVVQIVLLSIVILISALLILRRVAMTSQRNFHIRMSVNQAILAVVAVFALSAGLILAGRLLLRHIAP